MFRLNLGKITAHNVIIAVVYTTSERDRQPFGWPVYWLCDSQQNKKTSQLVAVHSSSTFRLIPMSRTCWIMSKISTMVVVLSAPVSILNPNHMHSPLPLLVGVPYLNQNVPLLISYNILTFLVFYTIRPYCGMVRRHNYRMLLLFYLTIMYYIVFGRF